MEPDLYIEFLELPPGPRPPNHYAILAIPLFESDRTVIHDAGLNQNAKLRRWALHPDRKTADRVQDMLNELGRATFVLEDPERKAKYDRELAEQLGVPVPTSPAPAAPGSGPTPSAAPTQAAEAPAPPRACPSCRAPMNVADRFCSACGFEARAKVARGPSWLAELARELREAPRWVWAFHLAALGLALAFLSGPWLWAFLALGLLALPWMILRMPWSHIALSVGSLVALFLFLSWVTRGTGIENLWKGIGRAETTARPAPLIVRVEKAIGLRDRAAAVAVLAELRKLDPKNPRLPELEAKVAALRPKVYTAWPFDAAEAKRRQEETARVLGVEVEKGVDLGGGVKLALALIPAGEFMMGSPKGEEGRFDHEDLHRVTIAKPFWMGKHEVTQEQWDAVMGNNPASFKGAKNPVETVSWDDIQGFLQKLNARAGGGRFALPTEAQWEYACRAGTSTRFSYGDDDAGLGGCAWYGTNSQTTTHPVGQKAGNAWGLCDMHGNVWEWCASPYVARYDGSEHRGAEANGEARVLRGGSWYSGPGDLRSAYRLRLRPDSRGDGLGFRVVRAAAGP